MNQQLEELRSHLAASGEIYRGKPPSLSSDTEPGGIVMALTYSTVGAIFSGIVWGFYTKKFIAIFLGAMWGGTLSFLIYSLWPMIKYIEVSLGNMRFSSIHFFDRFLQGQNALCLIIISFGLVYGVNHTYSYLIDHEKIKIESQKELSVSNTHKTFKKHKKPKKPITKKTIIPPNTLLLKTNFSFSIAWIITTYLLIQGIIFLKRRPSKKSISLTKTINTPLPFKLWLGKSTGRLAILAHSTSLAGNQNVALNLEDAAQNILILGGIGSGKTTRAIHPLLIQLLDQDCGGLIFDIKGDFQKAVMTFSDQTKRKITILGVGHEKINLLAGLSPEISASFLKSAFLINGKAHGDAFWIDTATELCRNTLGVLSFLPSYYSLQGLYRYLFDLEFRLMLDNELDTILHTLDDKSACLLNSYWQYHNRIFDKFDEKVKAGVNATIAQVLSPFNHPDLIDAFCSMSENHIPMEGVLNGAIYLVNLPLSIWGLGGKVAYNLIKLRFYNVMQQRTTQTSWNQSRPVFFMCDEFQEIVSANRDGLSDLNFWDKSRSRPRAGIIN